MPPDRTAWAAELRAARARLNLDQIDVADKAGVSRQAVSEAENGRGSETMFATIAVALGTTLPQAAGR